MTKIDDVYDLILLTEARDRYSFWFGYFWAENVNAAVSVEYLNVLLAEIDYDRERKVWGEDDE
jgi:hypothetical protein